MAQAKMVHGSPLYVDHTPESAVAAGDVVVIGELPLIAHSAIAADKLGALAAGGGVYDITADGEIAAGARVFWDDTANKGTATSTDNKFFGFVAPGGGSSQDGDTLRVIHRPGGDGVGAGSGS